MVKMKIKGDWNVIKAKLLQQYGNLTDNDLVLIKGKEEEVIGRIQQKIGKTKKQIREIILGL